MTADGFLNGLGLFETLRVRGAEALFPYEHWSRLKSSAQWLAIPFPSYGDFCQSVQSENDSVVRFNIVAMGGVWSGPAEWSFQTLKRPFSPSHHPIKMNHGPKQFPCKDFWRNHKTFSRGALQWSLRQALNFGFNDAVLWDQKDRLLESTIGNLFFQLENQWFTPPLSIGILPGILRNAILKNQQAQERVLIRSEWDQVTALVRSNSVQGLQPVQLVAKQHFDLIAAQAWIDNCPKPKWQGLLFQ